LDTITGTAGANEATGSLVDSYLDGTYATDEAIGGTALGAGNEGMPSVSPSTASFIGSLNQDMAEASHIASGEATPEEMEAFAEKNQSMASLYGGAAAAQEISNDVHEHELTMQTLDQAHQETINADQTIIQADSAISAAEEAVDDPG
jgi:hypothetical protein